MRLSPSFLSIRATDARLTASRKVVVSIVALTISVIGTGKKFLGLVYLNFFISFLYLYAYFLWNKASWSIHTIFYFYNTRVHFVFVDY